MKSFNKLRGRVILFLCLFGISPLITASVVIYKTISYELAEHAKEELLEVENKLSRRLETLIYFKWNNAILYSKLPLIKDSADNKKRNALLKEVIKQYYTFSWLGLTDENGVVIASSNDESIGIDAANSDWFKKRALASPAYVEEPRISEFSDGVSVVSFSAPVFNSAKRFRGMLHAEVKMDVLVEDMKNMGIGKSGSVLLARGDGVVIADEKGSAASFLTNVGNLNAFQKAKKGERGIIREIDHNGIDSFISYAPLKGLLAMPGFEWYILATQSTNETHASSRRVAYIAVAVILIGIAGIGFGSYFIAGGITNPIEKIVDVVEAVAVGDFSKEADVSAKGEIKMLAGAINQMIKAVRYRDAEVQTKARELTKLNEKLEMANIELRKTHAQLLRSGRLAAIGELSSKIAEDLNKPILNILYNTQLTIKQMNKISKLLPAGLENCQDYIKAIEASSLTCKIMAENLLRFSRYEKTIFIPVDIKEVIEEAVGFISYRMSIAKIKISKELPPSFPMIEANPLQLVQAMINIMLNAVEAMGEEGVLIIKGEADNRIVRITICDIGIGIPEEDIERIFEPFFTTKNSEEGTGLGLGLTIAQSIIKEHNGMIIVESSSDGTSFIIELPVKDK
ncbi:MAG: hypothetical protein A2Z50_02165 [Nitrospirae bacterium RBG_19FT_COMBO_42_15]|nr:MAG: hypothetical protein A2Z50_02165 [Nitrospirae bacterium RBG_19FT_COMBO_42_15]